MVNNKNENKNENKNDNKNENNKIMTKINFEEIGIIYTPFNNLDRIPIQPSGTMELKEKFI
ncbi:MAG: hypothetical protein LBM96_08310 [Methanobrevibacter sp.]|jgi:hypothetical protein|nr:hypothetical protein [Candidatus Methanoflexus mossambicus]